tara:strand:- start:56 stop:511 length:456 start_codon:yes stop_codon:yes gene_type:complete
MASKFFKKALKAAAGAGAVALALKGIKKKPGTKKTKSQGLGSKNPIDRSFAKKGFKGTNKTGDASAAEAMALSDRNKKIFKDGINKIAAAGGVSKLKSGGRVGKMGGGMMKRRMYNKGAFGMLSVKAGIDKNPKPTQADRIAGAKMKNKKR